MEISGRPTAKGVVHGEPLAARGRKGATKSFITKLQRLKLMQEPLSDLRDLPGFGRAQVEGL